MGQVTIEGVTYDVYGAPGDLDQYHLSSITGAAWEDVDEDVQDKAHLSATRALRSYVQACGGDADPTEAQPESLQFATFELALALATGDTSSLTDGAVGASNNKRLKAGSAEIEFFRPQTGSRFGPQVMSSLNAFLSEKGSAGFGSQTSTGAGNLASGIDRCSHYESAFGRTSLNKGYR